MTIIYFENRRSASAKKRLFADLSVSALAPEPETCYFLHIATSPRRFAGKPGEAARGGSNQNGAGKKMIYDSIDNFADYTGIAPEAWKAIAKFLAETGLVK